MDKVKNFLKGNISTFTFGFFILGMQLLISLLSVVMAVGENSWIKLLSLLMPLSLFVIIFMVGKSYALKDYQSKKNNDARLKNGEKVPAHRHCGEYAIYKPFMSAGVAMLPTAILFIIYAVTRSLGVRAAILMINLVYFIPISNFFSVQSVAFVLIGIVIMSASAVAGYIVQGLKLDRQYEEIRQRRENRAGGK